jgi:hypothetical protein
METLSLIFAIITVLFAILYITKMKRQINNLESAFKKLSVLYIEEKEKNKTLLNSYWKGHKRIF